MAVFDETSKMSEAIRTLFRSEFKVQVLDPDRVAVETKDASCAPEFVLYVSSGDNDRAANKIRQIREAWVKSIVVLLLPSTSGSCDLKTVSDVSAHHVLFRPCTRKKLLDVVHSYRKNLEEDDGYSDARANALFSAMMEFVGSKRHDVYVAYNRVSPLILSLCEKVGFSWENVQQTFMVLMFMLANVDELLVQTLMNGDGKSKKNVRLVYGEISKMADLLSLNASTAEIAQNINYVLKRYDGDGMPEDTVAGQEIPPASRIMRLLLDYNSLLQSGKSSGQALFIISKREGWYDEVLVQALVEVVGDEGRRYTRNVYPLGLTAGMVVAEDVYGRIDGKRRKIISSNEILTEKMVDYLQRHSEDILDITEPIKVVEELFSKEGGNDA